MSSDPVADRRQRARETFGDRAEHGFSDEWRAAEAAIEVATQVKITHDIIETAADSAPYGVLADAAMRPIIKAAFRAAGFEVVE